jgi:hypothetical protein
MFEGVLQAIITPFLRAKGDMKRAGASARTSEHDRASAWGLKRQMITIR